MRKTTRGRKIVYTSSNKLKRRMIAKKGDLKFDNLGKPILDKDLKQKVHTNNKYVYYKDDISNRAKKDSGFLKKIKKIVPIIEVNKTTGKKGRRTKIYKKITIREEFIKTINKGDIVLPSKEYSIAINESLL